jgi:ribokinase
MADILVVGSLNVDLTVSVPRFLKPGETMTGSKFSVFTGGKGGNQAVAAARLGASVGMIGCVGDDANGELYRAALRREGVAQEAVLTIEGETTGVAVITVEAQGENTIAIVPGANAALSVDVITQAEALVRGAKVCLFQLETPLVSIQHAAALAHQAGAQVILDPAPAPEKPLPQSLVMLCDYITPNETELSLLTGMRVETVQEAARAALKLIRAGREGGHQQAGLRRGAPRHPRGATACTRAMRSRRWIPPPRATHSTRGSPWAFDGLSVADFDPPGQRRRGHLGDGDGRAQGAMASFEQATALIDGITL